MHITTGLVLLIHIHTVVITQPGQLICDVNMCQCDNRSVSRYKSAILIVNFHPECTYKQNTDAYQWRSTHYVDKEETLPGLDSYDCPYDRPIFFFWLLSSAMIFLYPPSLVVMFLLPLSLITISLIKHDNFPVVVVESRTTIFLLSVTDPYSNFPVTLSRETISLVSCPVEYFSFCTPNKSHSFLLCREV